MGVAWSGPFSAVKFIGRLQYVHARALGNKPTSMQKLTCDEMLGRMYFVRKYILNVFIIDKSKVPVSFTWTSTDGVHISINLRLYCNRLLQPTTTITILIRLFSIYTHWQYTVDADLCTYWSCVVLVILVMPHLHDSLSICLLPLLVFVFHS